MLDAVDMAVERLPLLRRRIVQRHFRWNPEKRLDCTERAMDSLGVDTRMASIGLAGLVSGFADGTITADTRIQIDLDQLERLLQILLEYLPKLLEILIPIFTGGLSAVLLFALIVAVGSSGQIALAQGGPNCANGVCSLTAGATARMQPVSDTSPRVAAGPISPRIAAVVPRVSAVVNQFRPRAVIANTRQRFESKPVRSFFSGRQPIRRVVNVLRR